MFAQDNKSAGQLFVQANSVVPIFKIEKVPGNSLSAGNNNKYNNKQLPN